MSSPIESGVVKRKRGFAVMDREKQREIASRGGKAAHLKGTAHEWTGEEAKEAGRKGGVASHRNSQRPGPPEESAEGEDTTNDADRESGHDRS